VVFILKGRGRPADANEAAAAGGSHRTPRAREAMSGNANVGRRAIQLSDGLGLGSKRGNRGNELGPQHVHRLEDRVEPVISQPIQPLRVALAPLKHARQQRPNLGVIHAWSLGTPIPTAG
jgi:hypothetical protein